MFCGKCGIKLSSDQFFCTSCGSKIEKIVEEEVPHEIEKEQVQATVLKFITETDENTVSSVAEEAILEEKDEQITIPNETTATKSLVSKEWTFTTKGLEKHKVSKAEGGEIFPSKSRMAVLFLVGLLLLLISLTTLYFGYHDYLAFQSNVDSTSGNVGSTPALPEHWDDWENDLNDWNEFDDWGYVMAPFAMPSAAIGVSLSMISILYSILMYCKALGKPKKFTKVIYVLGSICIFMSIVSILFPSAIFTIGIMYLVAPASSKKLGYIDMSIITGLSVIGIILMFLNFATITTRYQTGWSWQTETTSLSMFSLSNAVEGFGAVILTLIPFGIIGEKIFLIFRLFSNHVRTKCFAVYLFASEFFFGMAMIIILTLMSSINEEIQVEIGPVLYFISAIGLIGMIYTIKASKMPWNVKQK